MRWPRCSWKPYVSYCQDWQCCFSWCRQSCWSGGIEGRWPNGPLDLTFCAIPRSWRGRIRPAGANLFSQNAASTKRPNPAGCSSPNLAFLSTAKNIYPTSTTTFSCQSKKASPSSARVGMGGIIKDSSGMRPAPIVRRK
jgi:hypothetical protein